MEASTTFPPALIATQNMFLANVLDGSYPVRHVREIATGLPENENTVGYSFKLELQMAVAIRDDDPIEVLRLAGSYLFPEQDKPTVACLLMCATAMLIERGYLENQ